MKRRRQSVDCFRRWKGYSSIDMRIGVFSDVHANLAACESVLDFIDSLSVDDALCLGDLVGYNAEPRPVLELIRRHRAHVVAGNHDRAVAGVSVPGMTSASVTFTHRWTKETLTSDELGYLSSLDNIVVRDEFCAVHGCYLNPEHYYGYVTGSMIETNLAAVAQNGAWPQVALCGHTHRPNVAWLDDGKVEERPLSGLVEWPASASSVIINPGSVGQPRDRDTRSSVALVDTLARTVQLHRIPYDVRRTQASLEKAGFPMELGERLAKGT